MLYAWAHHYSVHSFQFIHDSQSNSRCKWVCLSPIQRVIWGGLFILARLLCSLHTSNNNQNSIKLMFFSPDDRMVRIVHINRFTGIWLIRATSIRSGDYLNKCKIWHARQSTEFHSNIDYWLLSFALYLFSTRAAEKNAITLKFHKFQIDIASYITGSIDFSWKLLFLLSCVDFT